MSKGITFLLRTRSFPTSYDMDPGVGSPTGAGILPDLMDAEKARGHRFQQVAHALNGNVWFTWSYPGLEGPPPVVRHGDGYEGVVAGSVEALLWDVLGDEPDEEDEMPAWRKLRARLEREVGPRPPSDERTHPVFAELLLPPDEVLRNLSFTPFVRSGPLVPDRAEERLAAGDVDGAVAILEEGGAPEWRARAMALLLRAGRIAEAEERLPNVAERILMDYDESLDDFPPEVVGPFLLAADRRERPWARALAEVGKVRASPRGRRDRLDRLAKKHRKSPIGRVAIAAMRASTFVEEGDLDAAQQALDALRADPLAGEVAGDLDQLARRIARERKRPQAPKVEEGPSDLPIVKEIARSRRRSVETTIEALRAALQELAGPRATCEWDGHRFRLTGTKKTVDDLLDAAVDRLG